MKIIRDIRELVSAWNVFGWPTEAIALVGVLIIGLGVLLYFIIFAGKDRN